MSHVISYSLGNHEIYPPAWDLVRPNGHLLVITHGNSEQDDWARLLRYLDLVESSKFAINFEDIVDLLKSYGSVKIEKIETTLETKNTADMIEAMAFIASGGNLDKSQRFLDMADKTGRYIRDEYRKKGGFSFPFQHLFLSIQKPLLSTNNLSCR